LKILLNLLLQANKKLIKIFNLVYVIFKKYQLNKK
jgi:hypothetical protein